MPGAGVVEGAEEVDDLARGRPRHRGWRVAGERSRVLTVRNREGHGLRRHGHTAAGDGFALVVVRLGAPPLDARADLAVRALEGAARLRKNVRPGVTTRDPLRLVHEGLREIPHAADVDELHGDCGLARLPFGRGA